MSDGIILISLLPVMMAYFSGLALFFMLKDKYFGKSD